MGASSLCFKRRFRKSVSIQWELFLSRPIHGYRRLLWLCARLYPQIWPGIARKLLGKMCDGRGCRKRLQRRHRPTWRGLIGPPAFGIEPNFKATINLNETGHIFALKLIRIDIFFYRFIRFAHLLKVRQMGVSSEAETASARGKTAGDWPTSKIDGKITNKQINWNEFVPKKQYEFQSA